MRFSALLESLDLGSVHAGGEVQLAEAFEGSVQVGYLHPVADTGAIGQRAGRREGD